jgi:ABC-2 type transport system permease protein
MISLDRSAAVARTSFRIELRDPTSHLLMVAIPLIFIPFLIPSAGAQLHAEGYLNAGGAETAVPGFGVLFAFLTTQMVIDLFFHEFAWGTWERLRASAASTADVVVGKVTVAYLIQLVQLTAVLVLGALLYGYRPDGSILALALTAALLAAVLACFGVMLVALCSSRDLTMTLSNLVGMLMAGVGGAISPTSSMPAWARGLAHLSPAYWALGAVRRVSLEHAGIGAVLGSLGALAVFALVFATVAALRFRVDDAKHADA